MSQEKYIGMDVHQATISAAVMDAQGKLIMECLLETKAATIVEFVRGLQGPLSLTFEEQFHPPLWPLGLAVRRKSRKMRTHVRTAVGP